MDEPGEACGEVQERPRAGLRGTCRTRRLRRAMLVEDDKRLGCNTSRSHNAAWIMQVTRPWGNVCSAIITINGSEASHMSYGISRRIATTHDTNRPPPRERHKCSHGGGTGCMRG